MGGGAAGGFGAAVEFRRRHDGWIAGHALELVPDDRILLCSDGLTTMLEDSEILGIVLDAGGTVGQADPLVDAANRNGGEDNTTTILLRVS